MRSSRRGRLALAAIGAALSLAMLATNPADGVARSVGTGGASTVVAEKAQAFGGTAFTAFRSAHATWYGPGLYGNRTACGRTLRPGTVGVAHRTLRCGTPVKFLYKGRSLVAPVIDRGPFIAGRDWDLTNAVRLALRFPGVDQIKYAVAVRFTRR